MDKLKLLKLKSEALSLKELYSNYLSIDPLIAKVKFKNLLVIIGSIVLFFCGCFIFNYFIKTTGGLKIFSFFYLLTIIPLVCVQSLDSFVNKIPNLKRANEIAKNGIDALDLYIEKLNKGIDSSSPIFVDWKLAKRDFEDIKIINEEEYEKIKNKYKLVVKKEDFVEEQKLIRIKILETELELIDVEVEENESLKSNKAT